MSNRLHERFPGFNQQHALVDAKKLSEWLVGHLAEMPESVRKTATYDSFLGVLSFDSTETV